LRLFDICSPLLRLVMNIYLFCGLIKKIIFLRKIIVILPVFFMFKLPMITSILEKEYVYTYIFTMLYYD